MNVSVTLVWTIFLILCIVAAMDADGHRIKFDRTAVSRILARNLIDNQKKYDRGAMEQINEWMKFQIPTNKETGEMLKETKKKRKKKNRSRKSKKKFFKKMRGALLSFNSAIPKDQLMSQFRKVMRDEVKKAMKFITAKAKCHGDISEDRASCAENTAYYKGLFVDMLKVEQSSVRRITAAFNWLLNFDMPLPHGFFPITDFSPSRKPGSLERSRDHNPTSGYYIAPEQGIYQFHAILQIKQGLGQKEERPGNHTNDYIKVLICINRDCNSKRSIFVQEDLKTTSNVFTINVQGSLFLKKDEQASLFLENNTTQMITVLKSSEFNGLLLGH